MTILDQSTPHGLSVRAPALALLLGKPVDQVPDLAKLASPVHQAGVNDPPIFIAHGDQDNQMPVNQSLELQSVFKKNNRKVVLEIVSGADHGSPDYYEPTFIQKVKGFIEDVIQD